MKFAWNDVPKDICCTSILPLSAPLLLMGFSCCDGQDNNWLGRWTGHIQRFQTFTPSPPKSIASSFPFSSKKDILSKQDIIRNATFQKCKSTLSWLTVAIQFKNVSIGHGLV